MPVIDVNFSKLEATRKPLDKPVQNITVSNNSKIEKIEKKKLGNLGEGLFIRFVYTANYEPSLGSINVSGTVVFHDKKIKDCINEKKGEIALNPKIFQEVQNSILTASSIQALLLAKELKLPPPIQLPTVVVQEAKKADKGYA